MKKIMILGAGEMQIPVIQKAMDKSLHTIVADKNKDAPGMFLASQNFDVSTNDFEKILEIAKQENIDGILTTSDLPVNTVARVANNLSLHSMSTYVANVCTDKYLQREVFTSYNLKTPKYTLIKEPTELINVNYFPSIIKPIDSSASRGVRQVNCLDDLLLQYHKSKEYSKKGHVIIEELIVGREFSVETITQNGSTSVIAITEKSINKSTEGYFVEIGHLIPARITEIERQLISFAVLEAIKILEIDDSPTHTELILNANGVFIIEVACRLGGDFITSHLVPLATGVDMLENVINIALGRKVNVQITTNKVAAVQFLNAINYHLCVAKIPTLGNALIQSEIKPFHNRTIENSNDRLGYIILQTETLMEMEEILKQLN